jgi:hypothetical protein
MMPALDHARSLFRQRRARDAHFSVGMFGEPAWDLLLTLYIARCEGHALSVPALSRGLNMPLTDASEWICTLEASRLIQKGKSGAADEVPLIRISDAGFHTLTTMLLERPVSMSS